MALSRLQLAAALSIVAGSASAQTALFTDLGFGMDDAEITPDGHYAVVRENEATTRVRIYDLATGTLASAFNTLPGSFSGAAQDAVAVTNTRAVVLGSTTMVIDLTSLTGQPMLAAHDTGIYPRDVAITPDGTLAVVRGGTALGSATDGLFVLDLATGAVLASAPGDPVSSSLFAATYDVDSAAATNAHGVCISHVTSSGANSTRVTIFELHPAGGGVPQVAYETFGGPGLDADQPGAPHDVAVTPDGQHAVVRSDGTVGVYHLAGASPSRAWNQRLVGAPGPMGLSAMDSVEVTNERIATISRFSNGTFAAQLDLFDLSGNQWYFRMRGDPHDLAFTPDGTRLLVRTSYGVFLFDVASLPASPEIVPVDSRAIPSTHTSYGAGYDSVLATNTRALTCARINNSADIRVWDVSDGTLVQLAQRTLVERPSDVGFSPDENWAVVTGLTRALVFHLPSGTLLLDHNPLSGGGYPWCDGVVLDDEHAVAFGYDGVQSGWVSVIDLFSRPQSYCSAIANSSGEPALLHATGSASIARDDLQLWATHLPAAETAGYFFFGPLQISVPFGQGVLCVGGGVTRFPLAVASSGVAHQDVDYLSASISAGTTWNFQFRYRDPFAATSPAFNYSDAVSITFVP